MNQRYYANRPQHPSLSTKRSGLHCAAVRCLPADLLSQKKTQIPCTAVCASKRTVGCHRQVIADVGLVVTLYDVLEVTGGHIYPSDGAAHFEVQLTSVCSTPGHQSAVPGIFTTNTLSASDCIPCWTPSFSTILMLSVAYIPVTWTETPVPIAGDHAVFYRKLPWKSCMSSGPTPSCEMD